MAKKPQPYDGDLVGRAIRTEKVARAKADTAARRAGAATVFLQSLLGVLVHKLGGRVRVSPEDLDAFAHPEPVLSDKDPDGGMLLTSNPVKPPDPDGDVVVPNPPPALSGLCQRCGHEGPLLATPDPKTGELRERCPKCHAIG